MNIDNRELFIAQFIKYNKHRYEDELDILKRIDRVTLNNMSFGDILPLKKDRKDRKRSTDLFSEELALFGNDQSWECIDIEVDEVVTFTGSSVKANLTAILEYNREGLYKFKETIETVDTDDEDNVITTTTIGIVSMLPDSADTPELLLRTVYEQLSTKCNYIIEEDDLYITGYDDTSKLTYVEVRGDTIVGEIIVGMTDPTKLSGGNRYFGYMGEYPSSHLLTGKELLEGTGLSVAGLINNDSGWLKYYWYGKIIYIAKKPISNQISYSQLLAANVVDGSTIITIGDEDFRLRLPSGLLSDVNSEWNRLIYPVHVTHPSGIDWDDFTDVDLVIGGGRAGSASWMSEPLGAGRVSRGYATNTTGTVLSQIEVALATTNAWTGWRPVLEYIGPNGIVDVTVKYDGPEPALHIALGVLSPDQKPIIGIRNLTVSFGDVTQPIVETTYTNIVDGITRLRSSVDGGEIPLINSKKTGMVDCISGLTTEIVGSKKPSLTFKLDGIVDGISLNKLVKLDPKPMVEIGLAKLRDDQLPVNGVKGVKYRLKLKPLILL